MPDRPVPIRSHPFDGLRKVDGILDRDAVRNILPYGDEFLFVDRVLHLTPETVESQFRIPLSAPYLDGHFVGLPIMPGALMSEAFAQAGAILVRYHLDQPESKDIVGHHVESARFLSPALPGDLLTFRVELLTRSRHAARLQGGAWVGDRQVGKMRVVVAILERETLRRQIRALRESTGQS